MGRVLAYPQLGSCPKLKCTEDGKLPKNPTHSCVGVSITDVVEIHFIEMAKFRKLKNKNLKEDKLQRWLAFFREDISEEELKELIEMDRDIKRAEEKIEYLGSDPKTIALYKARERSLHERANMISSAREEGIAQGIEEGIEQGKIETAKEMLADGESIDKIVKYTKLMPDQISKIKSEMQH